VITLLQLPKEHRAAIKCPECGKKDYFYDSMSSPFHCSRCFKIYPIIMPLVDSKYFRLLYFQRGTVVKNG